jgi:AcrR family transcriptional regulator
MLAPGQRIVSAAIELVNKSGGSNFTVQQVVDLAGVGVQTFYRHFESKDEIMLAVLEEVGRTEAARIERETAATDDPLERLYIVATGPARAADKRSRGSLGATVVLEMRRLMDSYPDEVAQIATPYLALLQRAIEDAAKAGFIDPVDPGRDAALILHMVAGASDESGRHQGEADRAEADAHLWHFCLRGLRATDEALLEEFPREGAGGVSSRDSVPTRKARAQTPRRTR